jgi:hypothetical protein
MLGIEDPAAAGSTVGPDATAKAMANIAMQLVNLSTRMVSLKS